VITYRILYHRLDFNSIVHYAAARENARFVWVILASSGSLCMTFTFSFDDYRIAEPLFIGAAFNFPLFNTVLQSLYITSMYIVCSLTNILRRFWITSALVALSPQHQSKQQHKYYKTIKPWLRWSVAIMFRREIS
jgi:hypothetical protein